MFGFSTTPVLSLASSVLWKLSNSYSRVLFLVSFANREILLHLPHAQKNTQWPVLLVRVEKLVPMHLLIELIYISPTYLWFIGIL